MLTTYYFIQAACHLVTNAIVKVSDYIKVTCIRAGTSNLSIFTQKNQQHYVYLRKHFQKQLTHEIMLLVYENKYGKAEYDATTCTIRTQYVGIASPELIMDLLRRVIKFSEKERIRHMIANLTKMEGSFTGAIEFLDGEFYPNMIKNGLLTYAMAVSKDAFTRFAATQLKKKVGDKLEWHAFPNLEDAEAWTTTQMLSLHE